MRLDKLALSAQEALQAAMGIASDAEAATVESEHMLKALFESKDQNISSILERIGADPRAIERSLDDRIAKAPKMHGGNIMNMGFGNRLAKVLDNAVKAATRLGDSYATTEHLLIALADDPGDAGKILNVAGVTSKRVEQVYSELRGANRVTDAASKTELAALDNYGRNLTQAAREGKLDPVSGRIDEISRTIQVLSRRTQNNPERIGEPGT
ncbi:MAG: ATP-dependent chaperone ClpB, partial [Coriobacteriales bacterium]|nr:ATP-dependent chaperone ClpB [Coriobacteriales bacterium]